jgi:uncharacterized membrane protein YebE (DUF533 family)
VHQHIKERQWRSLLVGLQQAEGATATQLWQKWHQGQQQQQQQQQQGQHACKQAGADQSDQITSACTSVQGRMHIHGNIACIRHAFID